MACSWLFMWIFILGLVTSCVHGLGVNWGTYAKHNLPPWMVVQMLKANGIQKVKLFDADQSVLTALAGSGIEVMVAIANVQLSAMNNYNTAKEWIKNNVQRYVSKGGTNITYVAVGNEPFLRDYKDMFTNTTLPALANVQKALNESGLGKSIKATVPLNADIYYSPWDKPYPSAGVFRNDIADLMIQLVKFLHENNAPLLVNIYPFINVYQTPNFPLNYAFFDGPVNPVVDRGTGIKYTNMFDGNYDTFVSILKGAGYGDMTIMVGEIGWPTDGDKNANRANAARFYNGLLPKLASNKGTPLKPGYIEVYLFALLDEDDKSVLPGNFERHWGLFGYDGQPKFPVDFSGKGKTGSFPVGVQNVKYLPQKWCMMKPDAKVEGGNNITGAIKYACDRSDCTALTNGSSCNDLDANGKASYAFNMYYQVTNQSEAACDFQGLGTVTTKNISQGDCIFPIQIATLSSQSPSPPPALPSTSTTGAHSTATPLKSSLVVLALVAGTTFLFVTL